MEDARKSGCIGGLFRFAAKCVLWLTVLAILLVVTIPLWISPVVTSVLERMVPDYTGTNFLIDRFYVNPYSGTLDVRGVKLANPNGFGDVDALTLSSFRMRISIASLFSDTVVVNEISVDDASVSYYYHDGKSNYEVIMDNVDRAGGEKARKSAKPDDKKKDSGKDDEAESGSGKKFIIERLRVAGVKVRLAKSELVPAIPLPPIELTDIGKETNGSTLEEVGRQIMDVAMKSMSAIGEGLGAVGGLLGAGSKQLTDVLGDGGKEMGSALKGIVDKAGSSTEAAGDTASKAVSGVTDAAKGTADVLGETTKKAVEAVEDTTKKAAEGVRNLFKGLGK